MNPGHRKVYIHQKSSSNGVLHFHFIFENETPEFLCLDILIRYVADLRRLFVELDVYTWNVVSDK
jgi:hypothetical protein